MLFIGGFDYLKATRADRAREARSAKLRLDALELHFAELERRTDRLAIACQALWELLREEAKIPEETVYAKMEEIDLRDGHADGRIGTTVVLCPSCGRPGNSKRGACLYCGKVNRGPHIVE
jgi:hypothetical protein